MARASLPTLHTHHRGGPWPFVDLPVVPRERRAALAAYLGTIPGMLSHEHGAALVPSEGAAGAGVGHLAFRRASGGARLTALRVRD